MLFDMVQSALAEAAEIDCGKRETQKKKLMRRVLQAFAEDTALKGSEHGLADIAPVVSLKKDALSSDLNKSISH